MVDMSVLLVDDDALSRSVVKHQLRNLGVESVASYERARDALANLEEGAARFDVIMCDLQMPDMDGIEFVRHLARIGFRGGVLVFSGQSARILRTAQSLTSAHGLNILGALQKPVSPGALRSIMESVRTGSEVARRQATAKRSPAEVRTAIADRQLINHYQPKIEMKSGVIVGVESLVRWQHPSDGLVFPDQFIDVAEANGLVDELTYRVLDNALRDGSAWHRAGWPLSIAVNVSMHNLVSLDFPDIVAALSQRMEFPTARIVLEVTESKLMSDPLASLDILTRLRLKHIRLSIDDFGTGYSSLSQLREVPFDELKVDRSFIHGASRDPAAGAIVRASFTMAKSLGMTTVAEGVEDLNDWDWLRREGSCDQVQGYFIAKPMAAQDVMTWLEARRRLHFSGEAAGSDTGSRQRYR